ncbi:MAG: hypothetical protein H0W83_03765 [Planctomycetes bacterium]|nr:hypothetical protein [Planctomycetota bacterium]
MPLPAFSTLPKRQQQYILYGAPTAVSILVIYLIWKSLATLGPIDNDIHNEIDPTTSSPRFGINHLPSFLQRDTGNGIWNDIATAQAEINVKKAVIAERPGLEAQLEALRVDIKAAEERLPRDTEKAEMREMIERLAREIPADIGTVELQSVKIVDGADKNSDIHTITFQTELVGDTDGIIKYIDSLEKNQRFMSVNSLSIKGGTLTGDVPNHKIKYGLHTVRMDIVTYVWTGGKK